MMQSILHQSSKCISMITTPTKHNSVLSILLFLLFITNLNFTNALENDPNIPTNSILISPTSKPSTSTTKTETSSTDNGIQRLTLTRPTTTNNNGNDGTISSNTISTNIPSSLSSENSQDKEIFKMIFTIGSDDSYYNGKFQFGKNSQNNDTNDEDISQNIGLRLDLIQPNIWVMNYKNFEPCSELYSKLNSYASEYSTYSSIPASITTASFLTENCAKRGMYQSKTEDIVEPSSDVSVENNEPYLIPYMNQIKAMGEFVTDDFNFNLTNGYNYEINDFTFLNVNDTNMYVGGLGLAGNSKGSSFLQKLVDQGIIKSQSYSLWFNNITNNNDSIAQLIPGIVNKKYYIGNLYSFDMIPHQGVRYNSSYQNINQDLSELILPIINIDDIKVERIDTGQSLSIKSITGSLPVLLDSRIIYSYLPIEIIVNLAIQTNAYYSSEASRWLVNCDLLTNGNNSTLDFQISSHLLIKIPFRDLLVDAIYQGNLLHFEDGSKACYLTVLPTDDSGFNSLGLPFLKHIYLVVDNDFKKIGIAESNKYLEIDEEEYLNEYANEKLKILNSTDELGNLSIYNPNSTNSTNSTTNSSSIGYIESGIIPFATPMTYDYGQNATLSYSTISKPSDGSNSVILDIPARLSGAIIRSGSIYLSGNQMITNNGNGSITASNGLVSNNVGSSTSSGSGYSLNFGNTRGDKIVNVLFRYLFCFGILMISLILL
ncbi:YPS7 [Candida pseudojiufengensis]|uniref:YPS7 n=1 Tax=Candida pseudojiufengensis TaxID=497109 RepID=UPI00222426DD|nr:YPS7 [Candida pseudojiufengensis]KAI5959802.1 YPS7 [Candida pseudojiufengensis]